MLIKWPYKLVAYWGYEKLQGETMLELFNLAEDPQELNNLYQQAPDISASMLEEILEQVNLADQPFM